MTSHTLSEQSDASTPPGSHRRVHDFLGPQHVIDTVWTAVLALRHIAHGTSPGTTSDPEAWAIAQTLDTLVAQLIEVEAERKEDAIEPVSERRPSKPDADAEDDELTKAEAVANVQRAIAACEAATGRETGHPVDPLDDLRVVLAENVRDLVLAMGYVSAAWKDPIGVRDDESPALALKHLINVKLGLESMQRALVDAGVIVDAKAGQ